MNYEIFVYIASFSFCANIVPTLINIRDQRSIKLNIILAIINMMLIVYFIIQHHHGHLQCNVHGLSPYVVGELRANHVHSTVH